MHRTTPTRPLFPRLASALACALALATVPCAHAGPVPWTDAPYSYYADNAPIANVLRDFAASFSLSLELSPLVEGKVSGRFNAQTPTEFMDRMASVYGLTWFTHAGTLFVARTTEMSTRSITSGGSSIAVVRQALTSLGVLDARFGWGELPEQGVALVSGPPAYVALVERTMATLPLTAGGQQVAVFRLKHASVDDRTILYRDRQITTPGLAQVLRNLITGGGGSSGVNNALISSIAAPLAEGMPSAANTAGLSFDAASSGQAAALAASPNGTSSSTGARTVAPAPSSSGARGASSANTPSGATAQRRLSPSIQADSRLNALIVQDTPERIPLYKALIDQLDVPTPLIEIEAMIIDINSTKLDELGISWTGRKGGTVGGFGNMAPTGDGSDLVLGALQRGASIDPSSLVVSSGNFLVNRIRALEGTGDASIQSRPSILTIDNIGALLDLSETFYIRSVGERVATVTPITAGTTLRVTPHFVQRAEGPVIQLDVDIEDGQIQETRVDAIPTVRRSVVSTQAIVGEGQTLLIGGYRSTQQTNDNNRVPVVGQVPLLGLLFSHKTNNYQTRERLFMIKPRLVSLPAAAASAVEALRPSTQ
ncbi:type III secretion system outer membrane ring subunit SctC [Acidovorax sp.]|uniref:type III secretion system outer membrane ring subunit SctC n=1 Tax=Acidovorax sp. TaxID=1872122 RepID=UPI003CFDAA99